MCDAMVLDELRNRAVAGVHRWVGRCELPQLGKEVEVRQHRLCVHPEINQASNVVDTDRLERVDEGQAPLRCAEQSTRLVVALERVFKQSIHLLTGEVRQAKVRLAVALLEGGKRRGILLDETDRAPQVFDCLLY